MRRNLSTNSRLCSVTRVWVIVWMLGIPLIHVHPEVDHHHGGAGHTHGGTVHTVFARGPDCGLAAHKEDCGYATRMFAGFPVLGTFGHPAEQPEIPLWLLSDSTNRKSSKPTVANQALAESVELPDIPHSRVLHETPSQSPPRSFLTLEGLARAPPSRFA